MSLSSLIQEEHRMNSAAQTGKDIDFRFLPKDLTERCQQLIESYHGVHGYRKLADLLWHPETREFVALHRDLWPVFRKASLTRSAKQAHHGYVLVATILLSLEVLASDFADWGKRFPSAKLKADLILGEHLPNARTWLMNFYLYQWRRTMDRAILNVISPPTANPRPHAPDIDFSERRSAVPTVNSRRPVGASWE
jgi:hypothetical protein